MAMQGRCWAELCLCSQGGSSSHQGPLLHPLLCPCCAPCCPPNRLGIADRDSSCLRAWCQHFAQGMCSDSSSHSVSCHGAWGREAVFHCVNL